MCGSACVYVWVHVCRYARGGWLSRGGALYGASGTMKPVAEPRATEFGSGTKYGGEERNGCATSLYAEGPARRGKRLCAWPLLRPPAR